MRGGGVVPLEAPQLNATDVLEPTLLTRLQGGLQLELENAQHRVSKAATSSVALRYPEAAK